MLRAFLFTITLCLLISLTVYAQSQRPAPTPGENSNPIQEEAKSTPQQTAPDQRGTDQKPIVVKIMESPKTQDEFEKDRKEREEKAANDRQLATFTALLVVVACLQLITFVAQAILLGKTLAATKLAAEAAKASTDLADKSLTIGERAYLIIDDFYTEGDFAENRVMEIYSNIINTGRTPGRITEIFGEAQILEKVPEKPIYGVSTRGEQMVGSGREYGIPWRVGTITDITSDVHLKVMQKRLSIFVYGKISYLDIFNRPHETGFCAMWIPATGGFFIPRNVTGYNFWT